MEIMILLLDEPEENFTDFVENLPAHVSLPCLQPSSFLAVWFASQLCSRSFTVNLLKPTSQQTCGDVIPSPAADPRIYIFYQKY